MLIEGISFSGMAVSLLCILLLLSKKYKKEADKYFMVWLIICIANIGYYIFPSLLPQYLQTLGFTFPILSISVLYLYVSSIAFSIPFHRKYILKHSLFFVGYNLLFILTSCFYKKIIFVDNIPYFDIGQHELLLDLLTLPMAFIPMVYIILCYLALIKYQKILPQYYSSLEKINLNWLKWIILSLIFLLVFIFGIISLGPRSYQLPFQDLFKIVGAIQSIYVFIMVFFGLKQSIIIDQPIAVPDYDLEKSQEKTGTSDDRLQKMSEELLDYMKSEKPYLDEELSLSKLSSFLGVSSNQLSQMINQNLNTNFYKFVNSYRINEVKEKLKDSKYDHYSILGIAFESGFNSKSTFNKIFKEETGLTPSEYKKSE